MAEIKLNIDPEQRDRIARLWMNLIEEKVRDKTINATESAILARVLIASGWSLDPTRIPVELQHKLTEDIDLSDPATADELGILPIRRGA